MVVPGWIVNPVDPRSIWMIIDRSRPSLGDGSAAANKRLSAPIRARPPDVTRSTRISGDAGKNSVRCRLLRSPTPTVRLPVACPNVSMNAPNTSRPNTKLRIPLWDRQIYFGRYAQNRTGHRNEDGFERGYPQE